MPAIAESLGHHTLCLAVWGNRGPTAIHWEPSREPVSDQLRLGLVMSTTQCATGKAFAAFLPPEVTRAFIDEDLRVHRLPGEDTHARREALDAELLETRTHGIARATNTAPSRLHNIPVNAFSAPIFDRQKQMVLALSVTAPASRMTPDWDGDVPRRLLRAAEVLSQLQ